MNPSSRSLPPDENCISPEMAAIYREKSPTQRLKIAFDMWRSGHKLITAAVKHQFPDWDDQQRQEEVARRMSNGLL